MDQSPLISQEAPTPADLSKYRPNVGIMIINRHKKVWIGLRSDAHKLKLTTSALQMPQGGIDEGETPEQAAWRELYEETGLTSKTARLIAQSGTWRTYEYPARVMLPTNRYIGQRQKWFLFLLTGTDDDFNLTVYPEEIEFTSFSWRNLQEVPELAVPFKRDVYTQVVQEFAPIIENLTV